MSATPAVPPSGATVNVSALMHGRWTLTPITVVLLAINVAVFTVMLIQGAGLWHSPNEVQLAWGANFGPATRDGQWWRLGTAMFLHFGLFHLALNMWALWDGCRLAERLYGHWRFLAIYISAGLAGNLFSLLAHGDRAVSGGASGAIFGAYGALLMWLWRERRQVHPIEFRWIFGGGAAFAVAMIVMGQLVAGIDNAAHLGGLFCGALAGRAVAKPLSAQSPLPGMGRWVAILALLCSIGILLALLPQPGYRWSDEQKARTQIRQFLLDEKRFSARGRSIFESDAARGASFEDLAARIDSEIASGYTDSFEELSAINLGSSAPSASTLEYLKQYARLRAEASHALADALVRKDPRKFREAQESFRRAPAAAREEAKRSLP